LTAPHDSPTAAQLVEAVREWLERDVMPNVKGGLQFHSRVAVNVLAMVERELELGSAQAAAHKHRLESLGVHDDEELARRIETGEFDNSLGHVLRVLRGSVEDKLAVANPKYLES
jgi:hypothetical protein